MKKYLAFVVGLFAISSGEALAFQGDIKSLAYEAIDRNSASIEMAKHELSAVSAGRSQVLRSQELLVSQLRELSKSKTGSQVCVKGLGCFVVNDKSRKSIHAKMIVAQAVLSGMRSKEEARLRSAIDSAQSLETPFLPGLFEKRENLAAGDWGVFDRDVEFVKYIGEGFHARIKSDRSAIAILSGWKSDEITPSTEEAVFKEPDRVVGRLPGICVAEEKDGVLVIRRICSVADLVAEMRKVSVNASHKNKEDPQAK